MPIDPRNRVDVLGMKNMEAIRPPAADEAAASAATPASAYRDICCCTGRDCVLTLALTEPLFCDWRNRALASLPLDRVYQDLRPSPDGWLSCADPLAISATEPRSARVASDVAGVYRGTLESPTRGRFSAAYVLAIRHGFDDLETGYGTLAELSNVPLPRRFADWTARYRTVLAERMLASFSERCHRGAGLEIRRVLENDLDVQRFAWIAHAHPARFERALLLLRDTGARGREVVALKRAILAERRLRFGRRQPMHVADTVTHQEDAAAALEIAVGWAASHRAEFWDTATHPRFTPPGRIWAGRLDSSNPRYLAFAPDTLRSLFGEHGLEYAAVLHAWHAKGWLLEDADGNPRWQVRVADARHWMVAIKIEAAQPWL